MSYSISISGHKDVASSDEGRAFEETVAEAAREFVAGLEGVTGASMSAGHLGYMNLMDAQEPTSGDAPAEEPAG